MTGSDYIFISGDQINIGTHGDHDFVFASGEPVNDSETAASQTFTYESGSPIVTGEGDQESIPAGPELKYAVRATVFTLDNSSAITYFLTHTPSLPPPTAFADVYGVTTRFSSGVAKADSVSRVDYGDGSGTAESITNLEGFEDSSSIDNWTTVNGSTTRETDDPYEGSVYLKQTTDDIGTVGWSYTDGPLTNGSLPTNNPGEAVRQYLVPTAGVVIGEVPAENENRYTAIWITPGDGELALKTGNVSNNGGDLGTYVQDSGTIPLPDEGAYYRTEVGYNIPTYRDSFEDAETTGTTGHRVAQRYDTDNVNDGPGGSALEIVSYDGVAGAVEHSAFEYGPRAAHVNRGTDAGGFIYSTATLERRCAPGGDYSAWFDMWESEKGQRGDETYPLFYYGIQDDPNVFYRLMYLYDIGEMQLIRGNADGSTTEIAQVATDYTMSEDEFDTHYGLRLAWRWTENGDHYATNWLGYTDGISLPYEPPTVDDMVYLGNDDTIEEGGIGWGFYPIASVPSVRTIAFDYYTKIRDVA